MRAANSGRSCIASPRNGISVLVSTHYMDEAERCHKLAYILDGRLLAQGTAAEIIAAQHLETYELKGGDLGALAARLQSLPGVEEVAAFGDALHVTGAAGRGLAETLASAVAGSGTRLARIDTSIEDVFIHMMRTAGEGRRDAHARMSSTAPPQVPPSHEAGRAQLAARGDPVTPGPRGSRSRGGGRSCSRNSCSCAATASRSP